MLKNNSHAFIVKFITLFLLSFPVFLFGQFNISPNIQNSWTFWQF